MNASPLLKSDATIEIATPVEILAQLGKRFGEYGSVTATPEICQVVLPYGTARAQISAHSLDVHLEAPDMTSLAYLQMGFAEHILDLAGSEKPKIAWRGSNLAGGPLPYFREMRVVGAENVTPRMRRVRLAGNDLERFSHGGLHVRLLLPPAKGVQPVWPIMGEDGRAVWPEGERPVGRVYTIRSIDAAAGLIDVDFVLHPGDEMPGANWAANAVPGDVVGMTGPGGGTLPDADMYLIAGDETALPAIARMLEEMPAGRKATVFIEIADDAERQDITTDADAAIHWLPRNGRPAGTTDLLVDALRAQALPRESGRVFVWAGCEFAAFKAIRSHCRKNHGLTRDEHMVAAYWRRGVAGEEARREE